MKLNVYYGNIKKTFEGDDPFELVRRARKDKLYKQYDSITFRIEEDEDGDNDCEC